MAATTAGTVTDGGGSAWAAPQVGADAREQRHRQLEITSLRYPSATENTARCWRMETSRRHWHPPVH